MTKEVRELDATNLVKVDAVKLLNTIIGKDQDEM